VRRLRLRHRPGHLRGRRLHGGMNAPAEPRSSEPRVAVIGAGLMGGGIAQVFLAAGVPVTVYDPAPAALDAFPGRIRAGLDLLGLPSAGPLALLSAAGDLADAVRQADLVIEAAPENLAIKRDIFAEL